MQKESRVTGVGLDIYGCMPRHHVSACLPKCIYAIKEKPLSTINAPLMVLSTSRHNQCSLVKLPWQLTFLPGQDEDKLPLTDVNSRKTCSQYRLKHFVFSYFCSNIKTCRFSLKLEGKELISLESILSFSMFKVSKFFSRETVCPYLIVHVLCQYGKSTL